MNKSRLNIEKAATKAILPSCPNFLSGLPPTKNHPNEEASGKVQDFWLGASHFSFSWVAIPSSVPGTFHTTHHP